MHRIGVSRQSRELVILFKTLPKAVIQFRGALCAPLIPRFNDGKAGQEIDSRGCICV